jgi:MFS family permease
MMPLGLAIAGPLSDVWGPHTWFVIGGVAAAALGAMALGIPSVVHLESRGVELARLREQGGEVLEVQAEPGTLEA